MAVSSKRMSGDSLGLTQIWGSCLEQTPILVGSLLRAPDFGNSQTEAVAPIDLGGGALKVWPSL